MNRKNGYLSNQRVEELRLKMQSFISAPPVQVFQVSCHRPQKKLPEKLRRYTPTEEAEGREESKSQKLVATDLY